MSITIYSATGCVRCKVAKQFLNERGLNYEDRDALGEGKEAFKSFYKSNRQRIYRGAEGVEFPIYYDGECIRQGLPAVLAHLVGGADLRGFFKPGKLHGQWLDGIFISGGALTGGEKLLEVLTYLKKQNFKIQIDTNGVNADLLVSVFERGLADRVIMEVKGPLNLYDVLLQQPVDPAEIEKSIALVSKCSDYSFVTTIAPVARQKGDPAQTSYITPAEIAETAHLIRKAAGDNRQPYRLKTFDPKAAKDDTLRNLEALTQNALFKYRAAARKHQFKTEILRD
jgi:pyruvate-formate lyase-activating enzyme/glutaredoxin